MKKFVIMLALLSGVSFYGMAQTDDDLYPSTPYPKLGARPSRETISLSAYSYVYGSTKGLKGDIVWDNPIECNYDISVVLSRYRILMVSEDEYHDYLIIEEKNDNDYGNGERWIHLRCINENDVKCDVHIMTIDSKHARISFLYGNKYDGTIHFYNCERNYPFLDIYK